MPSIFSSRKGPRELAIADNIKAIESVQKSPIKEYSAKPSIKPQQSLAEAWQDADVRFCQATKNRRSLRNASPQSIDAYLEQWAAKCEVDNSDDARKKNQMICVLSNILDGIDVVGGIVAGGASLAFPPAGACFGAISFLIDIPRQVEKVYDTLLVLFAEVEEFLVRFKILKRIDDKQRLDMALIEEASRMLLSFVDICILSIKLLEEHKVSTVFKAALLKNDSGVGAALEGFRRLAKSLDSLTSTVAFEHILVVEETVREVHVGFKSIMASTQETRTERINADRLRNIEARIFDNNERSLWEDSVRTTRSSKSENSLPGTCDVLEGQVEYQKWLESTANHATLFLLGEEGTGKSYMLESLRERLETLRTSSKVEEEKMYVAFHAFNAQRTKVTGSKGQGDSRIPFALRSMALQVAAQSPPYAKELEGILKDDRKMKSIDRCKSLWQALRLSTFRAPAGATMYLLFDGLDQETDIAAISELYKALATTGNERSDEQFRIRTVFTGDLDKIKIMTGSTVSRIDMSALTKTLMPDFMINEMKRLDIFQGLDKKSKAQYQKVVQGLGAESDDSFREVTKKLERIQIAIQDDLPSSKLDEIIKNKDNEVGTKQAKQRLDIIASTMKPVYISQANQIITWILYSQSGYAMEIEELEAILLLQQDHDTLNSLEKKVDLHFNDLFVRVDGCLMLKDNLEDALRESESLLFESSEKYKPLISMDISIANSDDSVVQSFLSDLNACIIRRGFDFRAGKNSAVDTIHANRLKGHLDIIRLCFKLLNDGWSLKQETEKMVWYALEWLPKHLAELAVIQKEYPSQISSDDLRMIGQGLVTFLSEPYDLIRADYIGFGSGSQWFEDTECIEAIRLWLNLSKDELQARERRWVDAALDPRLDRLGFMRDFARSVGRKWATHRKGPSYSMYSWLDRYIENVGNSSVKIEAAGPGAENLEQLGDKSTAMVTTTLDDDSCQAVVHMEDEPNTADSETVTPSHNTSQDALETRSERSDHENDPASVGLQPQQRVQRVIDWVEQEVTDFHRDGVFSANIADTYNIVGEASLAIEYFEKAREDPATYLRALIGLAQVKQEAKGTREEAVQLLLEAISLMEKDWKDEELKEHETDQYFGLLEEAGGLLDELGRTSDAVSLFERSLEVKDNVEVMFITLRLMCKAKRESDAIELLDKRTKDHDCKPLSECILQCADQYQTFERFESMIRAIRGMKLRNMIMNGLQEAIDAAEKKIGRDAKSKLLHLHAIIIATGTDEDRWQIASSLWDDVLSMLGSSTQLGFRDRKTIFDAARGATGCRFDRARAKLLANPMMTTSQQDEVYRDLHDYTTQTIIGLRLYCGGRLHHPGCYVHAMSIMLGRIDDARRAISEDMQLALEILSDEDKTNDVVGIGLLVRILNFMGDKAGALSAFSLLDRQHLPAAKNDEPGSINMSEEYSDSQNRFCDGCSNNMTSADIDGFWSCRFCPDFDLCTACHSNFISGELRLHLCNPNHEYIHLYHTEYAPEEVETDKVRIDWEYIQLDDGKFERKGGRIVQLSEWIEELRKSWNLPEGEAKSEKDE